MFFQHRRNLQRRINIPLAPLKGGTEASGLQMLERHDILSRLNSARLARKPYENVPAHDRSAARPPQERIQRFRGLMEAVGTVVCVARVESWTDDLWAILAERNVETLLCSPGTQLGQDIERTIARAEALRDRDTALPRLVPYSSAIEDCRDAVFKADASITSAHAGIAQNGSLVIWPTPEEPRLMSLVTPLHIAVLCADRIRDTLGDLMREENWKDRMPTNLLLVSGPSKTADIEVTLVHGVHGPKSLIVMLLEQSDF